MKEKTVTKTWSLYIIPAVIITLVIAVVATSAMKKEQLPQLNNNPTPTPTAIASQTPTPSSTPEPTKVVTVTPTAINSKKYSKTLYTSSMGATKELSFTIPSSFKIDSIRDERQEGEKFSNYFSLNVQGSENMVLTITYGYPDPGEAGIYEDSMISKTFKTLGNRDVFRYSADYDNYKGFEYGSKISNQENCNSVYETAKYCIGKSFFTDSNLFVGIYESKPGTFSKNAKEFEQLEAVIKTITFE